MMYTMKIESKTNTAEGGVCLKTSVQVTFVLPSKTAMTYCTIYIAFGVLTFIAFLCINYQ